VLLAGCGDAGAAPVVPNAAPDRVVAGPQGAVGQFVVECTLDQVSADDPIVHPGHAGASHLHQFFGAVGVGASTDHEAFSGGPTTCQQQGDTAAYWAPLLVVDGTDPVAARRAVAYYRAGPGVDPSTVAPYPAGLMLVAGDATATEPQPLSIVAWTCGAGAQRSVTPPDCSGGPSLRMIVTFPDCWNGADLTAGDWGDPAARHAVYSGGGACPATHPVPIPQLQLAIDYDPVPADRLAGLALTSGDILSGHADFWNTWDQTKLVREVAVCIHRDLVCSVSG
jgi:hypothetical protein